MIQALPLFALPSSGEKRCPTPLGQSEPTFPPTRPTYACRLGLTSLAALLPQIGVSRHRWKQLEAISLIHEQRENSTQTLAYNARPFVLCGIPLRRPPRDQLAYLRRNGKFFLEITGHPRFGLPYGQDRLIPIWIATLALRQKSRVVRFKTASQILDFFHLSKDGRYYRRMVEGFRRIFAATIFFGTEEQPGGSCLIDCARFHFFESMRLWFAGNEAEEPSDCGEGNIITLTEAFYDEISQHRIPVEREVVAALANAPGVLDFYVWLVWKSWSLRGRTARIPLLGTGGLTDQLGNTPYAVERTFRLTVSRWLRTVKALWPGCTVAISEDGQALIVHSSVKSFAICRRACEKVSANPQ